MGFINGITGVERHAELVYAESSLSKALLGIAHSGDWLAFIKEVYVVYLLSTRPIMIWTPLILLP